MTSSALAEQPLPSTPVSMSFAVTPELSPLTTGRGGSTSIPLTPEIVEAGSPAISSRRDDFQKRWQLFDARIEHRLDEVASLLKPSTYYSEPTYATNLPLPHSTSVVPFTVTDDNCLSLDELKRLSRSNKHSVYIQPARSRQDHPNLDNASQSKKITLRSAKEIMAADKRTGPKSGEELESSKPKMSGKTPDGQSDTEHESSAVLDILNEIQSVGNSATGANGKSAPGPQKPSGLGLLSSGEVTSKPSAKISTPTMPSSAVSNSKRSKNSSSEKLTHAPTPQMGGISPRGPKDKSNDASGTSSTLKHSPTKGYPKVNFILLRTLLKDKNQEDWSLPALNSKSIKSQGPRSLSPTPMNRNGVKAPMGETKQATKAVGTDKAGKLKSTKENISSISSKEKANGLARPILRIHLALLPEFSPALNAKTDGESSKRIRDDTQSGAAKKRKTKDVKKDVGKANTSRSNGSMAIDHQVEDKEVSKGGVSMKAISASKGGSQDSSGNEVEEGEALSTSSSPTVVAATEKQTTISGRSEPIDAAKIIVQDLLAGYLVEIDENNIVVLLNADPNMIPEIVEVKVMIETLRAFVDGHLPHFVEDHEHLNDTDLGLQHDIGLGHEKNAVEGRGQGRMSDTLDDRRSSLRDKDRRRTKSHRRSRSRDWDQDMSEASGSGKSREETKSNSKSKDKNRNEASASKTGSTAVKASAKPSQPADVVYPKTINVASTTSGARKDNVEQLKVSSFMFRELALQYKRSADQSCQTQDGELVGMAEYLHSIFNYILSYHFNDKFDSAENSYVRWENLQPLLKFVSQTLKKREEWHLYGLCMKVNALINFNAFRMRQTPVRRCMTKLHELIKVHSEATTAMSSEYVPQVEKLLNLHELANVQWDEGELYFDWQAFRDRFPNTWKQVCVDGDFSKGSVFGEEIADMKGPLFPMTPFSKLNHVAVMGKCIISEWITAHDIDFQPISDPTAL
ncbi:unnamed protein product [Umbelopsis vinacea]